MKNQDTPNAVTPVHELDDRGSRLELVVTWGEGNVLCVAHLTERERFVLGEGSDADVVVDAQTLGADRFNLVEGGELHLPPGARPVTPGDDTQFEIGELTFHIRRVAPGKRVAPRRPVDRAAIVYVGGTLALAGVMLGIMALSPPRGMALSMDRLDVDSRLVSYLLEEPAFEEPEPLLVQDADFGDEPAGAALFPDELPEPEGYPAPPVRQRTPSAPSFGEPVDAATAGILSTLSEHFPVETPSPFSDPLGADPMVALSGMMGVQLGDEHNIGGLQVSAGMGGSCPGCAVGLGGGGIGTGVLPSGGGGEGWGTTCDASCQMERMGRGVAGHMPRRASPVPIIRSCAGRGPCVQVNGSLSREAIRRVVRRHHNEIKFCYERSLQSNPNLEGRITTRFMISPAGVVVAATIADSSLRHQQTESCVTNAFRRFTFPAPDNGGMVSVNYPFTFSSH